MSGTIGTDLQEKLGGAAGSDATAIGVERGGVGVAVDLHGCDRYAAGVRGLSVKPGAAVPDVGEAAERIAQTVDVIDRLKVVEYDAPQQEAILRSAEPVADEGGVTYWEAAVTPGNTSVQRYHKAHAEPDRQVVVEPIMHRDLGKLADQLVEALAGDTP